ncbi:hypothetical protein [Streptomyces sp. NPDC056796]
MKAVPARHDTPAVEDGPGDRALPDPAAPDPSPPPVRGGAV